MNRTQEACLYGTLIAIGILWGLLWGGRLDLLIVLVNGVVSVLLAAPVRSRLLAIVGSVLITDLLFVVYFVYRVAYTPYEHPHLAEEAFLLPIVFVVETAPMIVLLSVGFNWCARRGYDRVAMPTADIDKPANLDSGKQTATPTKTDRSTNPSP